MVHADVQVASFEELEQAGAENLEFLHAFWKVCGEGPLLLLEPGHVRVAEEGDAIGREFENLVHGVGEAVRRLVGQAVDQIDIDAVEAELAGGEEQIAGHFERLNAMDGFLHIGVKILDAHAKAIEAELAESFEMFEGGDARVDLDANFGIRREMEIFTREAEEVFDLGGRQIGWCATAPVKLDDRAIFGNTAADAFRLALEDA